MDNEEAFSEEIEARIKDLSPGNKEYLRQLINDTKYFIIKLSDTTWCSLRVGSIKTEKDGRVISYFSLFQTQKEEEATRFDNAGTAQEELLLYCPDFPYAKVIQKF